MATLTNTGIVFDLANTDNSISSKYWIYPAGTKKLFYQSEAPTGWVKDTTDNNKFLRVVNGSGGSSGGSITVTSKFPSSGTDIPVGFTTTTTVSGTVGGTTLALTQLPDHTHGSFFGATGGSGATPFSNAGSLIQSGSNDTGTVIESTGGGSHTHPWSGSFSLNYPFTSNTNFAVQYIDVIICTLQ